MFRSIGLRLLANRGRISSRRVEGCSILRSGKGAELEAAESFRELVS